MSWKTIEKHIAIYKKGEEEAIEIGQQNLREEGLI